VVEVLLFAEVQSDVVAGDGQASAQSLEHLMSALMNGQSGTTARPRRFFRQY